MPRCHRYGTSSSPSTGFPAGFTEVCGCFRGAIAAGSPGEETLSGWGMGRGGSRDAETGRRGVGVGNGVGIGVGGGVGICGAADFWNVSAAASITSC